MGQTLDQTLVHRGNVQRAGNGGAEGTRVRMRAVSRGDPFPSAQIRLRSFLDHMGSCPPNPSGVVETLGELAKEPRSRGLTPGNPDWIHWGDARVSG